MQPLAGLGPCLCLLILAFFPSIGWGFSDQAKLGKESEQRVLAILDPIDLHTQRIDQEWGEFLRKSFMANPGWKILLRDSLNAKFKDYKLDPHVPCHEFQCAFDAGNILSAEFVLFGSITTLDDLYAYTLNLVHVPTSQTVWSRVGQVRRRQMGVASAGMEEVLREIGKDLGPDLVRTGRHEKRGLMTVLDLSAAASTPSRIMAERVATHMYASRNYDIMGRKEMEELLKALEINKGEFIPTDSSIFALGGKMDITHLVYSRLSATRNGGMQLQLALYDIAAKKKVREWPSKSTPDFQNLMEFEDEFFTNMFKLLDHDRSQPELRPSGHWSWAGAGLALAMGAVLGYLSYAAGQDADREYGKFQNARSREVTEGLQARVVSKERSSLAFGVMGGISLAGAGGFLVFSF